MRCRDPNRWTSVTGKPCRDAGGNNGMHELENQERERGHVGQSSMGEMKIKDRGKIRREQEKGGQLVTKAGELEEGVGGQLVVDGRDEN